MAAVKGIIIVALLVAALLIGKSKSKADFPDLPFDGYTAVATHTGYGGPLTVAAGLDTAGRIIRLEILQHHESPLFFKLAQPEAVIQSHIGKYYQELFNKKTVEGVTGATKSTEAILSGIRSSVKHIAEQKFNADIAEESRPVRFGLLEVAITLLFVAGFIGRFALAGQIVSVVILGFYFNFSLHVSRLTTLLMGYLPAWQENLALYLLAAGFVLAILFTGSNLYCRRVCPFGAAHQLLGRVRIRKGKIPDRASKALLTIRNFTITGLIMIAFLADNPAHISYEPFATLFKLQGGLLQWLLLILAVAATLLFRNLWCHYICPIPVFSRVLKYYFRSIVKGTKTRFKLSNE